MSSRGSAGADPGLLASAISRRDVLFRSHIAESILSRVSPFHHRIYCPAEFQFTTTYHCIRLFLWVAQALLPVVSGHSREWLCHFSAWNGWAEFNF